MARTPEQYMNLHSVTDFGLFTPTFSGDTVTVTAKVSLGDTDGGVRISTSVEDKDVTSDQSLVRVGNYVIGVDATIATTLRDARLETKRLVMGLPESALTTVAGVKRLNVSETEIGSVGPRGLYVETMGEGDGPRTLYFPAVHLRPDGELNLAKDDEQKFGVTAKIVRPQAGPLYWVEDAGVGA